MEQNIDLSESNADKNVPRPERDLFSSPANDRKYIMLGLRIAGDFGITIAVPVVVFVLLGRWADDTYDKGPWFTILAFALASLLTGISIYKKAKRYGKEYEDVEKK